MADANEFEDYTNTSLGYLDQTAYAEGRPISAHDMRQLAITANTLSRRDQVAFCQFFQHASAGNIGAGPYYGRRAARPWWERVFPPVPLRYRPGASHVTVYLTYAARYEDMIFRFSTSKNSGVGILKTNTQYTRTAGGGYGTSTIALPVSPAGEDYLDVECIGSDFDTRATLGGANYTGTCIIRNGLHMEDITGAGYAWAIDSAGQSHATYGNCIRFADFGGTPQSKLHVITNVISTSQLQFSPIRDEMTSVDVATFEIFQAPMYTLACLLVVARYDRID